MDQQVYATKNQNGFVTLLSVILVGAVGLAVGTSLLLTSIDNSRTLNSLEKSYISRELANLCGEEALERIRRNSSFLGSGNIATSQGTCDFTVTDEGGTTRKIDSLGTSDTTIRKVLINLDQVSPINITSWQEVADF